jgi:DNA-binding CsgD family transcriptional regulator
MYKPDFSKPEMENIRSKIYLTKLENKILDLKLENEKTIEGIAMECNCSPKTVSNKWKEIIEKIYKVI